MEVEMNKGFLVLETGETYEGVWLGGKDQAGEIVFNTSHCGYEEIATDPSYFSQIVIMTAPMQGNYGAHKEFWESRKLWISGFISLDVQHSERDDSWVTRLDGFGIPVVTGLDTRSAVLRLRDQGVAMGALVKAGSAPEASEKAKRLILAKKDLPTDWCHLVSREKFESHKGEKKNGPRIAVIDFGCKENILRELIARSSEVGVFPSRCDASEIRAWKPDGIMLSNGPGDPDKVEKATETVRELLGWKFVFGICMGHQILSLALGAKTFKLKFGHRGGNHPVKDLVLDKIYMTSQNHGYAVDEKTLPSGVQVSHLNLYDQTVEGVVSREKRCIGVQFHPESNPGPRDARNLFDYFIEQL